MRETDLARRKAHRACCATAPVSLRSHRRWRCRSWRRRLPRCGSSRWPTRAPKRRRPRRTPPMRAKRAAPFSETLSSSAPFGSPLEAAFLLELYAIRTGKCWYSSLRFGFDEAFERIEVEVPCCPRLQAEKLGDRSAQRVDRRLVQQVDCDVC